MIKVQRVCILGSDKVTWVVLGDDYLPIEPIEQFLSYLRSTEKSPNTIKSYAHYLKHYFQFLQAFNIECVECQMYGRASHELLKKRFLCPV